MAAKKNPVTPNPDQTPDPVTPNPEPKVYKVGDIIRVIPLVGVVYEASEYSGNLRIQTVDGMKHRFIPKNAVEIAPQAETKAFLKTAPAELQPEAIIKREEEETAAHNAPPASSGDKGSKDEEEEE